MPTTPINTYGLQGLAPIYPGARTKMVRLPASVTYSKGQVLGETIGTNEVQSVAIDATGGTFTLAFGGQATSALAYNATAAVVQAALEALVTIGTGNVSVTACRRVWTLTESAGTDGGTFGLEITAGGVTTRVTGLAYDIASTTTLDAALEALSNVGTGGVAVTGSAGGPYTLTFAASLGDVLVRVVDDLTTDGGVFEGGIAADYKAQGTYLVTFQNALGYRDVAALVSAAGSLTGGAGTATVAVVTAGSGYADEQQTITRSGTVSGGTYTLSFGGYTTSAIAYDATAATVQAALEALASIGKGGVTVTGAPDTTLRVTFGGSLAGTNVAAMTVDYTSITGGGSIVIATPVPGGAGAGTHRAFDATGTDGRQVAKAILAYDVTTDSSGNHYIAGSAAGEFGAPSMGVPAYLEGYFATEKLTTFTAAALASNPSWHLVDGTIAKGVVKI